MVVLRLAGLLFLISLALSLALFVFTRNRRYLTLAWRLFQSAVLFLLVFMAFFVLERLVLVV